MSVTSGSSGLASNSQGGGSGSGGGRKGGGGGGGRKGGGGNASPQEPSRKLSLKRKRSRRHMRRTRAARRIQNVMLPPADYAPQLHEALALDPFGVVHFLIYAPCWVGDGFSVSGSDTEEA